MLAAETGEVIPRTTSLSKGFRGFQAVRDVNLAITAGSVHALVGPNGTGKTTLFNAVRPDRSRAESSSDL